MAKKAGNAQKKLGRPRELKPKQLVERYEGLKQFFEHNWGRIGLDLQKVRDPERVRTILRTVPNVEWCIPFRENAPFAPLLNEAGTKANSRTVSITRKQYEETKDSESRLSTEFFAARQRAEEINNALKVAIAPLGDAIRFPPFFCMAAALAEMLGAKEMTDVAIQTEKNYRETNEKRKCLWELLSSQAGSYMRDEIVKFARNKRFTPTRPENFAKAIAGLPEYAWLHSLRTCNQVLPKSTSWVEYSYQLFLILKSVVQSVKPLKLNKVEEKLRIRLMDEETDPLLRSWIAPNWAYMKQAFAENRGKRAKRSELPYKIVGAYLARTESPKSLTEVEFAKRERLV